MAPYAAFFAIAIRAPHLGYPPFDRGNWCLVYIRQDGVDANVRFAMLRQYFRGVGAQIACFSFQPDKLEEVRVVGLFGTASAPKMASVRNIPERYRERFWKEVYHAVGKNVVASTPAPEARKSKGLVGAILGIFASP